MGLCPSSVVRVAIISERIGYISFKFQLLLALALTPRRFFEFLKKKKHFPFFHDFVFFFVNMGLYGSKNFKPLLLLQITFEFSKLFLNFPPSGPHKSTDLDF